MSEDHLIHYCAPTLAGIKTASLFTCPCSDESRLRSCVRALNHRLTCRGLRIIPLRFHRGKALIYVYRPSGLRRDLSHCHAQRLLKNIGYTGETCGQCIAQLVRRLHTGDNFPHEIGLFLGYPPEDVEGFIREGPCGCKCTGCWKVYADADAARRRFDQYKKCSRIYRQCWESGTALERLVVSR